MKNFICVLALLWAGAAAAQNPQCQFATTPQVGYVLTYCGPTFGAVWTDNPATSLFINTAAYASSTNYGGTIASANIIDVLGSASVPNSTQDAVVVLQKWSNSTTNYNLGINPTIYVSNIMKSGAATARASAIYAETEMTVNAASSANFGEGIRGHCVIDAAITGGECTGIVGFGGEGAGATHAYMFGFEGEVNNVSVDASYQWNGGTTGTNHVEAPFIATARGSKLSWAAFMVNPFTAASAAFQVGFSCPNASPDVANAPVTGACFRSDARSTWGIDLTGHGAGATFGAIGGPNNIAFLRGQNAAGTQFANLLTFDNTDTLLVGPGPFVSKVAISSTGVATTFGAQLDLFHMTPPGTPSAGHFVIYVDQADDKLKAKGSSGTVTTLALP